MPALQYVRHALHCDFGSTSTISHSSVFPAAIIASFDSLLKGLNARCCWRSLWSACRWGWIKLWTLMLCDRFTMAFGTPEMLKSMFSSSIARLNLSASSRCSREPTSCTLCELASTGFPVRSWFFMTRLSSSFTGFSRSIWRTKFSLQLTNNLLGHRFLRSITNWISGLGWLGRSSLKCFSKWLLNEFSNWPMFNCRTQLIISFGPIMIVFQRDLWWWSRETNIVFHTTPLHFSIFQLLKYNGLEVFLEEWWHSIVFDRTLILLWFQDQYRPKIPRLDVSSMHCACIAQDVVHKSIYSGSVWLSFLGSTGEKNTVCLLLKFWPPGINPLLIIEWRLNVPLVFFGLLPALTVRFWGAPRGEHLSIRVRSYHDQLHGTHPLPATPFQCPRSRTATLG